MPTRHAAYAIVKLRVANHVGERVEYGLVRNSSVHLHGARSCIPEVFIDKSAKLHNGVNRPRANKVPALISIAADYERNWMNAAEFVRLPFVTLQNPTVLDRPQGTRLRQDANLRHDSVIDGQQFFR